MARGGERGLMSRKGDYTLERTLPEDICPVCGKPFLRMCRRSEWGYYYNGSMYGHGSVLTLLCSDACSREFARRMFMRDVRDVLESKVGRALKIADTEGITLKAAAQRTGASLTAMDSIRNVRWKEVEYLRQHKWEVVGNA